MITLTLTHKRDQKIKELINQSVNDLMAMVSESVMCTELSSRTIGVVADSSASAQLEDFIAKGLKIAYLKETFPNVFNTNSEHIEYFRDFSSDKEILYPALGEFIDNYYRNMVSRTIDTFPVDNEIGE